MRIACNVWQSINKFVWSMSCCCFLPPTEPVFCAHTHFNFQLENRKRLIKTLFQTIDHMTVIAALSENQVNRVIKIVDKWLLHKNNTHTLGMLRFNHSHVNATLLWYTIRNYVNSRIWNFDLNYTLIRIIEHCSTQRIDESILNSVFSNFIKTVKF